MSCSRIPGPDVWHTLLFGCHDGLTVDFTSKAVLLLFAGIPMYCFLKCACSLWWEKSLPSMIQQSWINSCNRMLGTLQINIWRGSTWLNTILPFLPRIMTQQGTFRYQPEEWLGSSSPLMSFLFSFETEVLNLLKYQNLQLPKTMQKRALTVALSWRSKLGFGSSFQSILVVCPCFLISWCFLRSPHSEPNPQVPSQWNDLLRALRRCSHLQDVGILEGVYT